MATLPMVLINQADIKSAGGVALRVGTQGRLDLDAGIVSYELGFIAALGSHQQGCRSAVFAFHQTDFSGNVAMMHVEEFGREVVVSRRLPAVRQIFRRLVVLAT